MGIFTKTAKKLSKDNSYVVFNGDLSPVYNKGNAKGIPVTVVEDFDIQPSQVAIKSAHESPIKKWLREERKVFNEQPVYHTKSKFQGVFNPPSHHYWESA